MDKSNFLYEHKENTNATTKATKERKNEYMTGFVFGFIITIIQYIIMFFSLEVYVDFKGTIGALFIAILLHIIIAFEFWAIVRFGFNKYFMSFSFILGAVIPFLVMFIYTVCWLFAIS